MADEQANSLLREKIRERCKARGIQVKDAYQILGLKRSSYYRCFEEQLGELLAEKMADFLNVSVDTVYRWHGMQADFDTFDDDQSDETEPQKHLSVPPATSSNIDEPKTNARRFRFQPRSLRIAAFFSIIVAILIIYEFKNTSRFYHQTADYTGTGKDYDLSTVEGLDNFHKALYQYEFVNVRVTINGDKINITADINTNFISESELTYIGRFEGNGDYLNGYAALHYQIVAEPNGEIWIGVMMLQIGTTGNAEGYWLTTHHDTPSLQDGPFAFGDFNLHRLQEKVRDAVDEKN